MVYTIKGGFGDRSITGMASYSGLTWATTSTGSPLGSFRGVCGLTQGEELSNKLRQMEGLAFLIFAMVFSLWSSSDATMEASHHGRGVPGWTS